MLIKIIDTVEEANKILRICSDFTVRSTVLTMHLFNVEYRFSLLGEKLEAVKPAFPPAISKELNNKSGYHLLDKDPRFTKLCMELSNGNIEYLNKTDFKYIWSKGIIKTGFQYANPMQACKPLRVYGYDINSAYPFAMTKPMPDTRNMYFDTVIGENQVGFDRLLNVITTKGIKCPYVCDLVESPFLKFVQDHYAKKKTAVSKEQRQKEKSYLNIATGIIAIHNPFIRNMIIYHSNTYLKSFVEDYLDQEEGGVVYCNIDSIYSVDKRDDIPVGPDLGQFKLEHENEYFEYMKPMWYQIGTETHKPGISGLETIYDNSPNLKYDVVGKEIVQIGE